ncbi:hypothetical protein [Bradyrhizobium sp. ARR65]|uniref:hypothetical protein n=1 Tax=Bradyrhizobium sp. ARR65 TaxID=1040989 RepID=UPI000466593C|nr:hypothetical protein [Bradyrhizobium sp. ARR65]
MNGNGVLRWRALFGWLGAVSGALTVAPVPARAATSDTPQSDYRSALSAPADWQAFASRLQTRFQDELSAEDVVRQFQDEAARRGRGADPAVDVVTVRAWIMSDGRIERVEFGQIDPGLAVRLRALLTRANVGTPPSDMLQPVHLRLSLKPKGQPGQGQ